MKTPKFATSDWHLFHPSIIARDERPFRDLEHMHKELIKNYNKIVPDNGVTFFLGDVVLGSVKSIREIIDQLNGTKIMIIGNHDGGHESAYNAGFDVVLSSAWVDIDGERVSMSHCPLIGLPRENREGKSEPNSNWHGEGRHDMFSMKNEGQFHLHGHIHSRPSEPQKKVTLGRQMDVGAPAHGYRPVHFGIIEKWIKTVKKQESKNDKP